MTRKTVREDQANETIRENFSNVTILEGQQQAHEAAGISAGGIFRGYHVARQLPSTSTEADVFVLEKEGKEFFLKLYRFGIDPKIDVLKSIQTLGEKYPENFLKVFETDFDAESKRWFEIQEYVTGGSLQNILDGLTKKSKTQRKKIFEDIAREAGESLKLLHENGFLHRDIKPSNILVRSAQPLKLVLIDFGITSVLDSELSKKATRLGGTPMYQSPESFSSVSDIKTGERRVILGPPTDWWGLGMILLEIATGTHPFKNLSAGTIAYSIATEAINIPKEIDDRERELLQGLLTRNPKKRWGWEQVSRWLKGERGIPNFFEENTAQENPNKRPLTFLGKKYFTLEQVAAAFIENEEAWSRGREFLLRGHVRTWLDSNQDFDTGIDLVNLVAQAQDSDEKVLRFVLKYGKNLPFTFGGHAITLNNLFIFLGKYQKRETLSELEKKIVDMLLNGRLLACLEDSLKDREASESEAALRSFLKSMKGKQLQNIAAFLNFYVAPEKYYCPFLKDKSSPEKVMKESAALNGVPMTLEYWQKANADYLIPSDLTASLTKSAASYDSARSKIELNVRNKNFFPRAEFDSLNRDYIIPQSIVKDLDNSSSHAKALNDLRKLKSDNLLLKRKVYSGAGVNLKKDLSFETLEQYKQAVYELQWGYDKKSVAKIHSSLAEVRQKYDRASGMDKEEYLLWISYLEYLEEKSAPLTQEDKDLLNNISLHNKEKLVQRVKTMTY